MGLRQCDKCGEMVDEAKAFCPACGHAFVEEQKRVEPSVFDSMEGTMQLGNTMYNKMLSDMGLNISDVPNKPAETGPPVAQPPLQPAVQAPVPPPVQQVLQPAVQVVQPAVQPVARPAVEPAKPVGSSMTKWLIIAAVVVVFVFILLIVIGLIGFIVYTQYR